MSMVTALTTWNSRLGAFFLLYFIIITISTRKGILSTLLWTASFFKAVNPWLPMSYSVSGLRQTISNDREYSSSGTFPSCNFLILFQD